MATNKYEYLKSYMGKNINGESITVWNHNVFHPVSEQEIREAEKILGFSFPSQLKEFYLSIGDGYLTTPSSSSPEYSFSGANNILPPLVSATFYKPLNGDHRLKDECTFIDGKDETHYMAEWVYELLQPGDLPFFEIMDSTYFMVLKPHSESPNAVWYLGGEKIEDSFEQFIRNLYYESPSYWESKLSKD